MNAKRSLVWILGVSISLIAAVGALGQPEVRDRIVVEPVNPHIWSGETVKLVSKVKVDDADRREWSLQWEFVTSSAVLSRDSRQLGAQSKEPDNFRIRFEPPKVRHVSNVDCRLRLIHHGQTVDSRQVHLRVYPAWNPQPVQRLLDNGQIALAEQPSGRLSQLLSDHGLTGKVLSEASAVQRFDGGVIVLGPDAGKSPALTTAVLETAGSGRTIVWLEPGDTSKWQEDFSLPKGLAQNSPESVILAPGHPVLAGMEELDLTWWQGEGASGLVVAAPDEGNFRGLVASKGESAGLRLIELFPGRGRIILCLLPVVTRFHSEPAARVLFENLLRHALSEVPQFSAASIWSPPANGLSQLAGKSGIKTSAQVTPKGVMIVIADDDAAAYALANEPSLAEKVRAHLEAGGKCVFIGASPESTRFLEKCGLRDVSFEPASKSMIFELRPVPLAWGVSREQLAAASVSGGETLLKYVVSSDSKVTPVAAPGVIAKAQVGFGEAILCQLALDRAPEDPACILLFRELLTNLGVRIKQEDQP